MKYPNVAIPKLIPKLYSMEPPIAVTKRARSTSNIGITIFIQNFARWV